MQLFIYLSFLLISYKIFRFIKFKTSDFKTGYEVKSDVFSVVNSTNTYSDRADNRESSPSDTDFNQNLKNENIQNLSVASNLHLIS